MKIFETCQQINKYLTENNEGEARNLLIELLDYHKSNKLNLSSLVNHLIRQTGLYPYLQTNTARWQDRFIYEAFKVDVGNKEPVTLHRDQSLLLNKLLNGDNIAVSAPTSFGKIPASTVIDIITVRNKFIHG